jgi:hypothetical protein
MARHARQGIKAGTARRQGIIIGHHRQGIGIIGIGMPSSASSSASARHAIIGIGRSRHRQGIGMPSACHHRQQQDAGRQNAAKWRSIVIQILKEC